MQTHVNISKRDVCRKKYNIGELELDINGENIKATGVSSSSVYNPKRITVIITAHTRQEFIRTAIDSVLSQDIDMNDVEVILIRNFFDTDIEALAERFNIKLVYSDSTLGIKIRLGIEQSQGEIITFLEDDDIYEHNRLSHILEIFSREQSIVYYHNASLTIDKSGITLPGNYYSGYDGILVLNSNELEIKDINLIHRFSAFNQLSSIAVRRAAIFPNIKSVDSISVSVDRFIFFASLVRGGKIVIDGEKLTRYRFHNSLSNPMGEIKERRVSFANIASRKLSDYSIINSLDFFPNSVIGTLSLIGYSEAVLESQILINRHNYLNRVNLANHIRFLFVVSLKIWSIPYLMLVILSTIELLSHRVANSLLISWLNRKYEMLIR